MVIYDLICDLEHEFEGWFKNSDDLGSQQASGLLTCPFCASAKVSKKLAAPKVTRKSNALATKPKQSVAVSDGGSSEAYRQLQTMLGEVDRFIESNFEDVGNRFADEAMSMHRGEKEANNIRGIASQEQLKELAKEGITALPLPPKPVDKKKLN